MGNKGVVRLGVIKMIRGNDGDGAAGSCDDDATGVVRLGVIETIRENDGDGAAGSCDDDVTGEGVSLIGTGG